MAEESSGNSWWSAWGNGLIENVKAKSAEAMSFVKNDLTEFVNVIHHDTTEVVADTADVVKDKIKVEEEEEPGSTAVIRQGMSNWLDKLSSTLKKNITQITPVVTDHQPVLDEPLFDRMQARLHEIQTNPGTYCNEPDGPQSLYERWSEGFNLEQHKGEISELLVNKSEIRSLYTKLVPGAVTNLLFWSRYFYKLHQLEQEEKRRAALVRRADIMQEDLPGWGDEEDDPWDTDDVSTIATDKEKEDTEKQKLRERRAVSETVAPKATESQQLQFPVVDSVKLDEVNKEQITEPVAISKNLLSTELNTDSQTEKSQDKDIKMIPNDNTNVSSKSIVDNADSVCSAVSDNEKSVDPDFTAKIETEHSPKIEEAAEEISEKVGRKEDGTLKSENKNENVHAVDRSKSKLSNSGVTLGTESDVAAYGEESCDQVPPVALRSNSSDESVDSSWSKLSDETNIKGVSGAKSSPSLSSSSSGAVVVTPVDDIQTLDWDDGSDDLDLEGEITEEEVKKMVEQLTNKGVDQDLDDDDWENWE